MLNRIAEIEAMRDSRVLLFAASNLDVELLPPLYDMLRGIGHVPRLDILFHCRGGMVTAARRVALLLREFTDHLGFIVPDRCESSATITILSADEIVAGPVAIFSPVDPQLQAATAPGEAPHAISAQDIRLLGEMASNWFGLSEVEARSEAMTALCQSIFPTTLTSFYRSTLEVQVICSELLALPRQPADGERRDRIVDALLFGYHSHSFALGRDDLRRLGLPVRADDMVEDAAWQIADELRGLVGGGARRTLQDEWCDAMLATRDASMRRVRGQDGFLPRWSQDEGR